MLDPRAVPLAAFACIAALLLADVPGSAQAPDNAPAAPKPYKEVRVILAPPVNDPALDSFRKQLADVAARQDRSALAAMVAKDFFWERGPRAQSDNDKAAIDTLAQAIGLATEDGWQFLADYANEPSVSQAPQRRELACTPAIPIFDAKEFDALLKATDTDFGEWGYPEQTDIAVHDAPKPDAKVVDKLGMYFIRVLPDDTGSQDPGPMLHIVEPSGKLGYIDVNALLPLGVDQLCYKKEGGGWKISAYIGQGAAE